MTRNIGIYLFDNVEVLDFAGPFEVFSTAARVALKYNLRTEEIFKVFTLADTKRLVIARGGMQVSPHYDIQDHPSIEVLIIPGGIVDEVINNQTAINWIKQTAPRAELTASVCTGAFALAKAGLLEGRPATTHWEDMEDLQLQFPTIIVDQDARWVDSGEVVTSAGISAGIDMSLHLVARLEGEDLATITARQMDYSWRR